jgi:hypothetical protein
MFFGNVYNVRSFGEAGHISLVDGEICEIAILIETSDFCHLSVGAVDVYALLNLDRFLLGAPIPPPPCAPPAPLPAPASATALLPTPTLASTATISGVATSAPRGIFDMVREGNARRGGRFISSKSRSGDDGSSSGARAERVGEVVRDETERAEMFCWRREEGRVVDAAVSPIVSITADEAPGPVPWLAPFFRTCVAFEPLRNFGFDTPRA